ncbi:MAG: XdhC family protein [Myxococcota bacterium]
MSPELLSALREDLAAKRPVAIATHLATQAQRRIHPDDTADALHEAVIQALRTDKPQTVEDADGSWFVRPYNPPLQMLVVGAVHIAQALVPMAKLAGYSVSVVDPRGQWANPERFPNTELHVEWPDEWMEAHPPHTRTAVIVLTHDPKIDDPALEGALRSGAFYIGALGSKGNHGKRRQRLAKLGFDDADLDRIHGPIGLAIGARSPAEIAIATLAQVTSALRQAK